MRIATEFFRRCFELGAGVRELMPDHGEFQVAGAIAGAG
jgi:hypothetical protein